MAFDPEFLDLMKQTVTVAPLASFDNYGDPSYSTTTTTYRCLVNQTPTVVRNTMGAEVIAVYTLYVASTSELSPTAQYTLPNGDAPAVQNVAIFYDEDGVNSNVVYLGGGQGG